jgi:prepilin-type N-terminal cleavage/methylation domain-containing protein
MGDKNAQSGVSLVELLVAVAAVAVIAAVAAPPLLSARRNAEVRGALAEVESLLKRKMSEAVRSGSNVAVEPASAPRSPRVRINPRGIAAPDGAAASGRILFQGSTGHPHVDGERRAAAVVLAHESDPWLACAVVVGASGTVRAWRRAAGGWEELNQ